MSQLAFYQAGDSYPTDCQAEAALCERLRPVLPRLLTQEQVLAAARQPGFRAGIPERLAILRTLVGDARDTVLIGRSSGCRVATMLAAEQPQSAVVCIGYPFRRSGRVLEPQRFAHLAAITTPTLILQGATDVYGGVAVTETYGLSPAVRVAVLEGVTHEFGLSATDWDAVARLILGFLAMARAAPRPDPAFDEAFYLRCHPDVAAAVATGLLASGQAHFRASGRGEGRSFRMLPVRLAAAG